MDDYVNANMKKNNVDYGTKNKSKDNIPIAHGGNTTINTTTKQYNSNASNSNNNNTNQYSIKPKKDDEKHRDQIYSSLQKGDQVSGKQGSPKQGVN